MCLVGEIVHYVAVNDMKESALSLQEILRQISFLF
jgi:hypothetical protein